MESATSWKEGRFLLMGHMNLHQSLICNAPHDIFKTGFIFHIMTECGNMIHWPKNKDERFSTFPNKRKKESNRLTLTVTEIHPMTYGQGQGYRF